MTRSEIDSKIATVDHAISVANGESGFDEGLMLAFGEADVYEHYVESASATGDERRCVLYVLGKYAQDNGIAHTAGAFE